MKRRAMLGLVVTAALAGVLGVVFSNVGHGAIFLFELGLLARPEGRVSWSAWTGHARTELRKRLRRAMDASPEEIGGLSRQILRRELVVLRNVREDAVESVRHILEALGADVSVSFHGAVS